MFVPCTTLLYDSTAATRTFKFSTTLLSISCGIRLISFLMISSLVCRLFSQTLSFRYPSENSQVGWDLGNRIHRGYRFYAKWACLMGSYAWSIQVFCSRIKVAPHFSNRTEHLNTAGITSYGMDSFHVNPITPGHVNPITPGHSIPKISNRLFSEGVPERQSLWKQSTDKREHHQKRKMDSTGNAQ